MSYNLFHLIPESLSFLVILYNRTACAIGYILIFIYLMSIKREEKQTNEKVTTEKEIISFNLYKGISRLSFAVYICHYILIRTLFFTSRNTFPTTILDAVSLFKIIFIFYFLLPFKFNYLLLTKFFFIFYFITDSSCDFIFRCNLFNIIPISSNIHNTI